MSEEVKIDVSIPNQQRSFRRQRPNQANTAGNQGNNVSARTLRNRRRRQRQRARRQQGNNQPNRSQGRGGIINSVTNELSSDLVASVGKVLQTRFNPSKGIFRASDPNSLNPSSLSMLHGQQVLTWGATQDYCMFQFCPTNVMATTTSTNRPPYFVYRYASAFENPDQTTGSTLVAGPFQTVNPSTQFRVISFELTISPISGFNDLNGQGVLVYSTDLVPMASGPWASKADFDNSRFRVNWKSLDNMICHWTPGQGDFTWTPGANILSDNVAGLLGYFKLAKTGTNVSYQLDWTIGIEYIPSKDYAPYVDLQVTTIHPNTEYVIKKSLVTNYNPLLLATMVDWKNFINKLDVFDGFYRGKEHGFHTSGGGGIAMQGQGIVDLDDDEDGDDNEPMGFVERLTKKACDTVEMNTGYDVCSNPVEALKQGTADLIGRVTGNLASGVGLQGLQASRTNSQTSRKQLKNDRS